ncbi:MAG: hypothetical protein ABI700_29945, partial [Chloroflexota bacterium]
TVEAMIQTLSSIAQGDYTYAIPAAPPAEVSLTEIPVVERSLLERELARFASRLQARAQATP